MNWQIMEIDVTDYSITSAGRLSMAQAHSSPFTCEQVGLHVTKWSIHM